MEDSQLLDLLLAFKNVVLEGVPGTGKSYAVESIAEAWEGRTGRALYRFESQPFTATVMHPSASYEDFIEGLRPTSPNSDTGTRFFDSPAGGDGRFSVNNGFFLRACSVAAHNPDHDVLVLLDELNRCNISSVLGDLLLTLEASRRAQFTGATPETATAADWLTAVPVTLPYSRRTFFVPENLY